MNRGEVRVCVLRIEGTNCEEETYWAFKRLGASPEKVHLKQLTGPAPERLRRELEDFHVLVLPGGFSSGDYVRAGAIFAARIKSGLERELIKFVSDGKPVLGICNGFQILVELGLLPGLENVMSERSEIALTTNSSARFECMPTLLKHEREGGVFTSMIPQGKVVMFPSAHAEGRLMFPSGREEEFLGRLEDNDQIVFRYVNDRGEYAGYPWNPNGSYRNIAGICNPQGNVFGLMPHPERVFHRFQHPDWTRGADPTRPGDGEAVFRSIMDYVMKRL
jgi:phosphoribosylformylglycinamidine synthase subunit PurQ / glutaminase